MHRADDPERMTPSNRFAVSTRFARSRPPVCRGARLGPSPLRLPSLAQGLRPEERVTESPAFESLDCEGVT